MFSSCRQHMEGYQEACPDQVEGFWKEAKWLIVQLMQDLEDQFKEDVKVQLKYTVNLTKRNCRWKTQFCFSSIYFLSEQLFSIVVSKRGIEKGIPKLLSKTLSGNVSLCNNTASSSAASKKHLLLVERLWSQKTKRIQVAASVSELHYLEF